MYPRGSIGKEIHSSNLKKKFDVVQNQTKKYRKKSEMFILVRKTFGSFSSPTPASHYPHFYGANGGFYKVNYMTKCVCHGLIS